MRSLSRRMVTLSSQSRPKVEGKSRSNIYSKLACKLSGTQSDRERLGHLEEGSFYIKTNGLEIIRSMPKRIRAVIKSKGHPINYEYDSV